MQSQGTVLGTGTMLGTGKVLSIVISAACVKLWSTSSWCMDWELYRCDVGTSNVGSHRKWLVWAPPVKLWFVPTRCCYMFFFLWRHMQLSSAYGQCGQIKPPWTRGSQRYGECTGEISPISLTLQPLHLQLVSSSRLSLCICGLSGFSVDI